MDKPLDTNIKLRVAEVVQLITAGMETLQRAGDIIVDLLDNHENAMALLIADSGGLLNASSIATISERDLPMALTVFSSEAR